MSGDGEKGRGERGGDRVLYLFGFVGKQLRRGRGNPGVSIGSDLWWERLLQDGSRSLGHWTEPDGLDSNSRLDWSSRGLEK